MSPSVIFQPERYLLNQFVEKHAASFSGDVLDVAGGDGKRYGSFFKHCNYRSLDLVPEAQIQASAESIPLPDNSQDGVLCFMALMEFDNPKKALDEIHRVLKPNGKLLLATPDLCPQQGLGLIKWLFTELGIRNLLAPNFEIISLEQRGGFMTTTLQNTERYAIDRFSLYKKPILGRLMHILSLVGSKIAFQLDAIDRSKAGKNFTLGHDVLAIKKP